MFTIKIQFICVYCCFLIELCLEEQCEMKIYDIDPSLMNKKIAGIQAMDFDEA